MNDITKEHLEEQFNGVNIATTTVSFIEGYEVAYPKELLAPDKPFTLWLRGAAITNRPENTCFVAEAFLTLSNEGEGNSSLEVRGLFKSVSPISFTCKEFLNNLTGYMFLLAERYVKEVSMKDKNGSDFILPIFDRSIDSFNENLCY